jgi:hypothetical protein
MPFEDLLVIILISLGLGFALGFFYVKAQITAIENRYRAELEIWKLEADCFHGYEKRKQHPHMDIEGD